MILDEEAAALTLLDKSARVPRQLGDPVPRRQALSPMSQQYLEETARDHPTKSIRARAKRELERYR